MKRALQEFVIEGVKTTIPFHIKLMDDPGFKSGIVGNSQRFITKKSLLMIRRDFCTKGTSRSCSSVR